MHESISIYRISNIESLIWSNVSGHREADTLCGIAWNDKQTMYVELYSLYIIMIYLFTALHFLCELAKHWHSQFLVITQKSRLSIMPVRRNVSKSGTTTMANYYGGWSRSLEPRKIGWEGYATRDSVSLLPENLKKSAYAMQLVLLWLVSNLYCVFYQTYMVWVSRPAVFNQLKWSTTRAHIKMCLMKTGSWSAASRSLYTRIYFNPLTTKLSRPTFTTKRSCCNPMDFWLPDQVFSWNYSQVCFRDQGIHWR